MKTSSESSVQSTGFARETNWWGAFVIGLAGTILVTGIAPYAVSSLGAASVPMFVGVTAVGVLLCFCLAELAAMMPDRTGGLPSYAFETYKPLGPTVAKHAGDISAWSYWLGWFSVAPINRIWRRAISSAFSVFRPAAAFSPFGAIGSPVSAAVLVISFIGLLFVLIPSLGIRLGAEFATILGVVSMVPLTLLLFLPLFKPSSMHWSNRAGFHLADPSQGVWRSSPPGSSSCRGR